MTTWVQLHPWLVAGVAFLIGVGLSAAVGHGPDDPAAPREAERRAGHW